MCTREPCFQHNSRTSFEDIVSQNITTFVNRLIVTRK